MALPGIEKEVNVALMAADFTVHTGLAAHQFKVLAQAVRRLRREVQSLEGTWEARSYTRGWDDASESYRQEIARRLTDPPAVNQELLECVEATHRAMDTLYAELILMSRKHASAPDFFPSQHPTWPTMERAYAVIQRGKAVQGQAIIAPPENALRVQGEPSSPFE